MIVPLFKLSQTPDILTIEITAKYVNFRRLEFLVEDDKLYFYCRPYHLNLHLPGSVQSEILNSKFDVDTGIFTIQMKKTTPGEHFKNLDLITRLLSPVEEKKKGDKIMIIGEDGCNVLWEDTPETAFKYGFAMKGLYDFHRVIDEYSDILKVDPRKVDVTERYNLMQQEENKKFNPEHYGADFLEEEDLIQEYLDLPSPWSAMTINDISFDDSEIEVLKNLPNKNYNLSEEQRKYCYYGLIDILYAYCYDCRTTSFEGNVQSGWTVLELAASLRWLVGFQDARSTILSAYRRSLIYPLFRNFNLCNKIFEDVKKIIALGQNCIVKCLLQVYKIFMEGDECRYILNDIFIKDYLVYVGKWDDEEWNNVIEEVSNVAIDKKDLNMDLIEIEIEFLKKLLATEFDSDDEPDPEEATKELTAKFDEALRI